MSGDPLDYENPISRPSAPAQYLKFRAGRSGAPDPIEATVRVARAGDANTKV